MPKGKGRIPADRPVKLSVPLRWGTEVVAGADGKRVRGRIIRATILGCSIRTKNGELYHAQWDDVQVRVSELNIDVDTVELTPKGVQAVEAEERQAAVC